MILTDSEKRMLDGENGEAARTAMEILLAIGKVYDAEKMISVSSAHVAGLSFKSHGVAGMEWAEQMLENGAKVRVPTTLNVVGLDRSKDLGFPREWNKCQSRIEAAYRRMGCYSTSTCVPYYCGFVPRVNEHIAWAESSAVVFTNSVLGACDNREGGPSALASALTGKTPLYGLHLEHNRKGDLMFKVETPLKKLTDYCALGNYVGRLIGNKIPVFEGIKDCSMEDLVYLGASLASSGGIAMFHIAGITPEAQTLGEAFSGNKYDTVTIGNVEIEEGYAKYNTAKDRKVDFVAIGCPHCSLGQVKEIAEHLSGRRVHSDVSFWVHTNVAIKYMAKQLGYVDIIEKAGGEVTQDLCTILGNPEALGFKTLVTNSGKMAFYAPGSNDFGVWFGDIEKCVSAAINGYFQD